MLYVFADCVLDPARYALHRAGHVIRLRPKVFQVLTYLLTHRERVVSRQELYDQVWPGQFGSEAALESAMRAVRQAIGDSGSAQHLIQTLHGHGYRFVAAVTRPSTAGPGSAAEAEAPAQAVQARAAVPPLPMSQAVSASAGMASAPDTPASCPPAIGTPFGEWKIVTCLVCTLVHTPPRRAEQRLDALHSLLRALHVMIRHEVQRYGGTLRLVAGQHFLALFGVPVAQEDHAQRAVLAALGLLQQVAAQRATLGVRPADLLAVHVRLHTDLVAVGGIGDQKDVVDAVVGTAAALSVAMPEHTLPGTILCSDTTARLLRTVVDLEAVGTVLVGGQTTPVMTYKVLGLCPQRAPMVQHEMRTRSQFVGRDLELTALHTLLEQTEQSQGQSVGIIGELGMGKSRLLDEFRGSLTGRRLTYLRGRCLSYGSAIPYLPVLDLLRHYCGLTEVDPPEVHTAKVHQRLQEVGMAPDEWASSLLHLLGSGMEPSGGLNPQAMRAHSCEALVHLCINGSQQCPLVLEIEDLQWIDTTSEAWIETLVERVTGLPILLLASYRPGYRPRWLDRSYATQLTLQRLTRRDSLTVIRTTLLAAPPSAAVAQEILRQADGNPFFLEELARTVEHGEDRLPLAVPVTIHAAVATRIDRLPATAKHLLQIAAVIGQDVLVSLLQAVAALPTEELHCSLRDLQAAELLSETRLHPTPLYTFTHALTQAVVYQSLVQSTRLQYHRQVAQAIEEYYPEIAATHPEVVAQHYTAAGLLLQAIGYWHQAGRQAGQRAANLEAVQYLSRGLELLATLPQTPVQLQQALDLQSALGPPLRALKGLAASEVEESQGKR